VEAERETAARLGVTRLNCPLPGDGVGDINQYAAAITAMCQSLKDGKPVLVHCHTGAQRTGGAIAFYRALVQQKTGKEVYAELLRFRHDPEENEKLIPYLNQHMRELGELLVKNGVIDRIPDPLPVVAP